MQPRSAILESLRTDGLTLMTKLIRESLHYIFCKRAITSFTQYSINFTACIYSVYAHLFVLIRVPRDIINLIFSLKLLVRSYQTITLL